MELVVGDVCLKVHQKVLDGAETGEAGTRAQAEEKNPLSTASDVEIGAQSVGIYVDPVAGTGSGAQTPSHQSCRILLGAVTPCKKPGLNIAADGRLFDGTEWERIGEGVDYGPVSYTGGL